MPHYFGKEGKGRVTDKNYIPERIAQVENLILLCEMHHKMVEDQSKNLNRRDSAKTES